MRSALFLDRDGIINEDRAYVHTPAQFAFLHGIFDLIGRARANGYLIVVVTNQSGIARGYFTEAQFHSLTEWMRSQMREKNADIDAIYHCPHLADGLPPYNLDCNDRKPNPGMFLKAARDLDIDLSNSIMIGDKDSDIEAARAAGVGRAVIVRAGSDAESSPQERYHSLPQAMAALFADD